MRILAFILSLALVSPAWASDTTALVRPKLQSNMDLGGYSLTNGNSITITGAFIGPISGSNVMAGSLDTNAFSASANNWIVSLASNAISRVSFATNATYAQHATNFWGLLSPTNLPAGLSTSNYSGAFSGNGSALTLLPIPAIATNAVNATNGAASGFFSSSLTNSGSIQTATENITGTLNVVGQSTFSRAVPDWLIVSGSKTNSLGIGSFGAVPGNTILGQDSLTTVIGYTTIPDGFLSANVPLVNGAILTLSNYVSTISGNATNQSLKIGANATNQIAAIATGITNGAINNLSNYVSTISGNGTNETLRQATLLTNFVNALSLNSTNEALRQATSLTNGAMNNLSNLVATISANATNNTTKVMTGVITPSRINVTGSLTNLLGFGSFGSVNANTILGQDGLATVVGYTTIPDSFLSANVGKVNGAILATSNYVATISQNATNEALRQATSLTNGAVNNLSNYVTTASLNATNEASRRISSLLGSVNTWANNQDFQSGVQFDGGATFASSAYFGTLVNVGSTGSPNPTNQFQVNGTGGVIGFQVTTNGMLFAGKTNQLSVDLSGNLYAGGNIQGATETLLGGLGGSSGIKFGLSITPTVTQSGSAGFGLLRIAPTLSSTGSGLKDAIEVVTTTTNFNVDVSGNQTNAGAVKASAFYGPVHDNADTATLATTASAAVLATNVVTGFQGTNANFWIADSSSFRVNFPSGAPALLLNTNGQFQVNDTSGNQVYFYSGAPIGSDNVTISRGGHSVLAGNATNTRLYDQLGTVKQTVTDSLVTVSTNAVVSGTLAYLVPVSSKTANYTVLYGDSGTCFNNNGAVGAITNTLPASSPGLHYSFAVVSAFNQAVKANGTDTIRSVGLVSAAGGLVFSSTVGSTVHLFCPASGGWWIDRTNGNWTIQ